MVNIANVPVEKAVEMLTSSPARIMKVYDKAGSLSSGKYADIVIFDDNFDVKTTIVGGKKIFEA